MLALTFTCGALPWTLAALLPSLGAARDPLFVAMLAIGTLANSISSVAWSAAISEVVPERLSGRYFARRNLVFGGWTLVAVLAAGHFVEANQNSMRAFGWIFFLAGTSRLMGLFFLSRMKFPPSVKERRARGIAMVDLLAVLRSRNYIWLCVFIGLWGLLLNSAMPFYTVYIVDRLNLGMGTMVKLTTLASLGGLATLKGWGRLSERFGNRPVLQVAGFIWGVAALLMWCFIRPGFTWHLYVGYFVVGAMTAGFQLTQFNLMIRLADPALRPAFVAVFLAGTSFLTAAGPLLGSLVLRTMPGEIGVLFGHTITSFHLLFCAAAIGCVLVTNLMQRVHEPAEGPVVDVWREMKNMRSFNPMLSVLSVGELLLTPRGLLAIARRSIRTVRKQVKAIEEVGEEIVSGGREVFTKAPHPKE
jgi:MFS family permease